MKKILFLAVALIMSVGAWADAPTLKISDGSTKYYYVIRSVKTPTDFVWYANGNNTSKIQHQALGEQTVDKFLFYFTDGGTDGNFQTVKIHNVAAGDNAMTNWTTWDATGATFYIQNAYGSGAPAKSFNICNTNEGTATSTTSCWNIQSGGVLGWKSTSGSGDSGNADTGSCWFIQEVTFNTFEPADGKKYYVKYAMADTYYLNTGTGTDANSKAHLSTTAEDFSITKNANGYAITGGNNKVAAIHSWNVTNEDYNWRIASIEDSDLNFIIRNDSYLSLGPNWDQNTAGNNVPIYTNHTRSYTWKIEQAPDEINYDGSYPYIILNVKRGTKVFAANTAGTALTLASYNKNDNNQKYLVVTVEDKNYLYNVGAQKYVTRNGGDLFLSSYPHEAYTTKASSDSEYNKIVMIGGNYVNNNGQGGVVSNWNSEDDGNRVMIVEANQGLSDEDYNTLVATMKTNCDTKRGSMLSGYDRTYGSSYGQFTWNKTMTDEAVAAASALTDPEASNYYTSLFAAIGKYDIYYTPAIVLPQANSFLRIKNAGSDGKYVTCNNKSANRISCSTEKDGSSIFFYDGTHLLSYQTGYYMGTDGAAKPFLHNNESVGDGIDFTFSGSSYNIGTYNVRYANGVRYLYEDGNAGSDLPANNTDAKYTFNLEEVTELPVAFHANGKNFATVYSPVALEIPEGVTAYVGKNTKTENENEYLVLEEIAEGQVIPANQGVVLEGTAGQTVDFTISSEESTLESTLTGTVATKAHVDSYVFSIVSENPGFYKLAETANLAGFKAYYVPATSENVQGFVLNFGEQTTGIESLIQKSENGISFDLQGRRVNANVKGISIVNNKKVIK